MKLLNRSWSKCLTNNFDDKEIVKSSLLHVQRPRVIIFQRKKAYDPVYVAPHSKHLDLPYMYLLCSETHAYALVIEHTLLPWLFENAPAHYVLFVCFRWAQRELGPRSVISSCWSELFLSPLASLANIVSGCISVRFVKGLLQIHKRSRRQPLEWYWLDDTD